MVGWEVRIVKICVRGLENAVQGLRQHFGHHFQVQGHSFSLYGLTLSQEITCLSVFLAVNWLTSKFANATLSLN